MLKRYQRKNFYIITGISVILMLEDIITSSFTISVIFIVSELN